ncbi:MAG: DUF3365 domain-containing protein [Nitrospiraceae bacterium]|nr:MAG: DUF3365 domain-containing protein [Nitrospiraceae bacterium]
MLTLKELLAEFRALKISLSLKFIIGVAAVLSVAMGVSLYFISRNHEQLILKQVDQQAKTLFRQIILTREWVADHGGVFVEKVPWKGASPYLAEPEIVDVQGRRYTKESPAMVTKELSKYALEKGLYWFHITSLRLVNPENAPDPFESEALHEFEDRLKTEASMIERTGTARYYRYIAPLYIEDSCLQCHAHQGYKVGDVRGAISIAVPMDYAFSMIRSGRRDMVLASIATISILMIVLYVMMKELVLRPVKQLKASMQEFYGGEGDQTSLIRTGDEIEELSKSFIDMSKALTGYHTSLEKKVQAATKSLEEANARLTELNERKSDFIAKISHELRTPMTSIKGAMDYLHARIPTISRSSGDTEEIMEFLEVVKKNSDRLIRMVNDTLDLERIESGMFDLHYSQVKMLSLIKEVIISFQTITAARGITFQIVSVPATAVSADQDRIRQVLINLVSNAINFSPDNSEIRITVTETDRSVIVTIRDQGPGIPQEVREKIFDKFYTVGNRYGTGLGLAICKGIIEAHKGEIRVADTGEKGAGICFTLPRKGNDKPCY